MKDSRQQLAAIFSALLKNVNKIPADVLKDITDAMTKELEAEPVDDNHVCTQDNEGLCDCDCHDKKPPQEVKLPEKINLQNNTKNLDTQILEQKINEILDYLRTKDI